MTDPPLISVVIPLYNYGEYIEECIQSVLAQSHENLEVIVVDNASTDDGPAKVRQIEDPRIHLQHIEVNEGIGKALNIGFARAKGDWISYLPSDDYWAPGFARTLLEAGERSHAGVVGCWTRMVDAKGQANEEAAQIFEKAVNHPHFDLRDYQQFRWSNPLAPNTLLWRRDILEHSTPLQENLIPCDYAMLIRAATSGCHFEVVTEKLLNCRWHGQNLGETMSDEEYLLDFFYVHLSDYRATAKALNSRAEEEIEDCHSELISLAQFRLNNPEILTRVIAASELGFDVPSRWPTPTLFKEWAREPLSHTDLHLSSVRCLLQFNSQTAEKAEAATDRAKRLRDELDRGKARIGKLKEKLDCATKRSGGISRLFSSSPGS